MNARKAKMIRKLTKQHAVDTWPDIDYIDTNQQYKNHWDLLGQLQQYFTYTRKLTTCKRKFMQELKKDVKSGKVELKDLEITL